MTKKSFLLNIALIAILKLAYGQDTIQLRNNSISIGYVEEISTLEVKYKKIENPDGPLYILNKYEVEKVKYQNGAVDKFEYVAPWRRKNLPNSTTTISHDTAFARPSNQSITQRVASSTVLDPVEFENLSYRERRNCFSVNNRVLKGRKLNHFLQAQQNPIINLNVNKAKSYRVQSYLGFLAIPMAAVGAYYLFTNDNLYTSSEAIKVERSKGIACLFASAMTVSYSVRVNSLRTKHLQKAVDAYNENRSENRLEQSLYTRKIVKSKTANQPPIGIINSNRFVYHEEVKDEYQLQEIMLKKHDPEIQQRIETARRGKQLRYIIFADIPLTITGFGILADALNHRMRGDELYQKQLLSSAFLVAGAACFTIGIYHAAAYKKNTKKAALRYNTLYND